MTASAWVVWNEAVLTEDFPTEAGLAAPAGARLPFSSLWSGGASVQQLLSRLDLSREHRDPLTDPRRLRLDRLDRLLDLVELLEETNDLLAKVFGRASCDFHVGCRGGPHR